MAKKKKQTDELASDDEVAELLTRPDWRAAATIKLWGGGEINALTTTLTKQIDDMHNGNMKRPEAMLLMQAHTLNELFNSLAVQAHMEKGLAQFESFLRIALKAQNQCRSTLETLAAIKKPPVIYTKQANISNGHQQINNGIPAQAEEHKNQHNELLEHTHGKRLDTRTKGEAIGVNSELEAVG
jgi:hypothetical protein